MSKKIYLFSLVLLALTFTACSETEEAGRYDNWQARSEAFIDSIANVYNSAENKALPDNDPEKLHAYKDPTNNQMLYVKKISKDENYGLCIFLIRVDMAPVLAKTVLYNLIRH